MPQQNLHYLQAFLFVRLHCYDLGDCNVVCVINDSLDLSNNTHCRLKSFDAVDRSKISKNEK
jgi:hypothetical protein